MADDFDWNQFSETPSAVEDPQFDQNPDLGLLNSLYGGQLAQAAPTWQTPPHDWNQYPTEAPPQSYEEQINQTQSDLDQQAQEAYQARQAAEQEAANQKRVQIEQTRARLQTQDAAKAQRQQDENFNPETGSSNNSPETLNAFDQALLGTGEAVAGFGRQAGGLLQAKAGFRDIGKKLTDYSTEQAKQFAEAGQVDPTDTTGQAIHWLASSAVGLAPIMAAGVIPGGAAAMMGLQSFGSNYASAVERYQADGDSYEEATRKAYLPAIVTGAISTAIGHYAGPNGLAALGSKAIVGETVSKIAGKIIQDAGIGGAQGLADSFANGLVQKATYDPEKPISQILMESLHAGAGGLLVGGLASGVHQGISAAERATRGPQPPVIRDVNPPELSSQTDNPNAINPPIQLPDQNVPRVTNPTVPVPEAQRGEVPNVLSSKIPGLSSSNGDLTTAPRVLSLPKIDVPETVLAAAGQALRINPLGLDQAVQRATENHPVAKFYDQLPDSIDTSTPKAIADAGVALQRVVTKIESSDLSPQEKAAGIAPIAQILTDLKPSQVATPETFNSVDELLAFRKQRLDEESQLYQQLFGINEKQAVRLGEILSDPNGDTTNFEKKYFNPEQQKKFNAFFEAGGGQEGFQFWERNHNFDPQDVAQETDPQALVDAIMSSLKSKVEPSVNNDRYLQAVIAARRLSELGFTQKDLQKYAVDYARRTTNSHGDQAASLASYGKKIAQLFELNGIQLPETQRTRLNEPPTQNPSEAGTPAQSPATEHPIGLRQADASGAEARVTGPDTGNGQPTPPARGAAVQPEANRQPTAVSEPVRQVAPIKAFHSTTEPDFLSFDPARIGTSVGHTEPVAGFYLTTNRNYKGHIPEGMESDFRSREAEVYLKNPLKLTGYDDPKLDSYGDSGESRRSAIEKAGYDGVILADGDEIIAFHPDQVVFKKNDLPAVPGEKGGVTNESKNQVSQETGGSQNQERQVAQPVAPIQTETAQPPVESKPSVSRASKVKKAVGVSRVEPVATEPLTKVPSKSTIKPTEQKKYLIGEVDRLIKEAPDTQDVTTTAAHQDNLALQAIKVPFDTAGARGSSFYDNFAAGARSLMEKYGISPKVGEKSQVDLLETAIDKARFGQLPHVTISVPGDGEFSIINSKEALKAFKERAAKFPTTTPKASVPSTPGSNPKSAGAVTKNPDHSDYAAAASLFHSEDENRLILQHAVSNGHEMVATDGWKLIVIKGKFGGSVKEPVFIDAKGKEHKDITIKGSSNNDPDQIKTAKDYPNYKQTIPTDVAPLLKGASTEELFNLARQAEMLFNKDDPQQSMTLVMNPDGTLGVTAKTAKGSLDSIKRNAGWNPADYQHNVQDGAKPITSLQLKYVQEIMTALRRIGNEKVDLYHKDELSPIVFKTKNAEVVLMPIRMQSRGESAPLDTPRPNQRASGPEGIKALLADPNNGLDADQIKVANALLADPKLAPLLDGITLSLEDTLNGDPQMVGYNNIREAIIGLSRSAPPEVFVHEPLHMAWVGLPARDKAAIETQRQKLLIEAYGEIVPPSMKAGMTSDKFAESRAPIDLYHLSNAEELMMHWASRKFTDRSLNPETRTIITRLKELVSRIVDVVKKALGKDPSWEQAVNNLLDGKFKSSPELRSKAEGLKASYVSTEDQAVNAEKQAATDKERIREGHDMASQHQDFLDSLLRAGASKAGDKVKRLLKLNDKIGITTTAASILGKNMGYAEAQSHLDPISRKISSNYAAAAYEAADRTHRELVTKSKEAEAEISAPGFIKKVDKQFLNSFKLDAQEKTQETAKAMLTTVLNTAKAVNADKNLSDIEKATLEGQLKEVSEAQRSSSALSGLVTDMTKVLASTPQGLKMLEEGGNRNDFRRIYRDVKLSAGQPLHSEGLMNWASYLLEKAPEIRKQQLALELASDPKVSTAISAFEKKFLEAFAKDPTKAVMAEVGKATSLAGNAAKAEFVWKTANGPLLRKFEHAQDLSKAVEISGKALSDPAIVALRKQIRIDSGSIGTEGSGRASTKAPFDPKSDIVFPSGKTISLSGASFGDEFNRIRTEAVAGLKEIEDHLANNPPGSENYDYYLRARDTLAVTLNSGSALKANDPMKVHNSTFGILWNLLYTSGGRLANALKPTWAKAEQIGQRAQHWNSKWGPITMQARLAAIESHPEIKFGTGRDMNFIQAHELWMNQVGNELAWSGNRQTDPYEVGDEIGTMGWKVTKADKAAIESQSLATEEGYKASGDSLVLDTTAGEGAGFTRPPAKRGKYGTVRTPNAEAAGFADDMAKGVTAFRDAKTDAEKAAAMDQMDQSFGDNFARHGKSFTQDRSFDLVGANSTPLDGRDGAFAAVLPMITDGRVSTTQEYWQALSEASGRSVAEVREIVLPEIGRQLDLWHKTFESDVKILQTGSGHETKNSFSLMRDKPLAFYSMYDYGFKNGSALRGFGAHIYSRSFDQVLNGLDALVKDLQRMQLERDKKVTAEAGKGNPNARKTVEARQRHDRDMDKSFDDYYDIENRIRLARQMQDRLNRNDTPSTPEGIALRGLQILTGASLGTGAAFNDIVLNPYYLGRSVLRIQGGWGKAGVLTAAADLDSKLRLAASVVYSGVKSGLNLFLADPSETIAGAHTGSKGMLSGGLIGAAAHIPMDRSLSLFLNRLIIPMVHEWGDNLHTRMFMHKKMVDHGIDPVSNTALKVSNYIMGGVANAGDIKGDPNARPGMANRSINTLMGAWEVLAQSTIGSAYRLNDTTMNQNAHNVYDGWIGSKIGPTAQFTDALKQVAVRIKDGHRPWDKDNWDNPLNELSPKEMTGVAYATRGDKYRMIDAHDRAGIDYRKLAHQAVNEYVYGDGAHKPYNEEKTYQLIHELALYENKQSKINESNILKPKTFFGKALVKYQSWATRQLSNFAKSGEIADSVTHGKSEAEAKRAQVIAFAGAALTMLSFVGAGALVTVAANQARRVFMKAMFNQVTAAKQPWEYDTTKAQVGAWARAGVNVIPYIGTIANAMFDDMATRASYDPSVAMLEKVKTVGQYVGGAISSKDPFYRLVETIESIVPDSKIILNRLDSQSGKRENINAANLFRRTADPDTVKPVGGRNFQVTELTPYGAKMVNAAVNGDYDELNRVRAEGVQVARDMGKADPEKAIDQVYRNQMAETKALKQRPTQEQRDAMLAKMSPSDRALIDRVESNYGAGAQSIGLNSPALTKESKQSTGGSVSRASRLTTGPARIGGGRVARVKGLSRLKKVRLARVKTGRRSLARYRTNRRVVA